MTEPRLPRLSGESPCVFDHGADGWVVCRVHGWTGAPSERSRVLVCPAVNEFVPVAVESLMTSLGSAVDRAKAAAPVAAQLAEALRERDEAIAHDRQPYPTAAAYEAVCESLHRREAQVAALVEALRDALLLPGFQSDIIKAVARIIDNSDLSAAEAHDAEVARRAVEAERKRLLDALVEEIARVWYQFGAEIAHFALAEVQRWEISQRNVLSGGK